MKEWNGVEFYDSQYEQIVKGEDVGLDVSKYANPLFTAMQMEALRVSMDSGVDIEWFAKPEVSANKMFQISQAKHDHFNVQKFVNLEMSEHEMRKVISKFYKSDYGKTYDRVRNFLKPRLSSKELNDLKYDFLYYKQLDSFIYKISELDSEKDLECLINPRYSLQQRATLWEGVKNGDVKHVAKPDCPEYIMRLYNEHILPKESFDDFEKITDMDRLLYNKAKSFTQMFNLVYGVLNRGFDDFKEKSGWDIDKLEMYVTLADEKCKGSGTDFLGNLKQYAKSDMSVNQLRCIKKLGAEKFANPDCPYNEEQMFVMGFFGKELPVEFSAEQMFELCSNWKHAEKCWDPLYSSDDMREIFYLVRQGENPEHLYRINPNRPVFTGGIKSDVTDSLDLLIPKSTDKVKRMNVFE